MTLFRASLSVFAAVLGGALFVLPAFVLPAMAQNKADDDFMTAKDNAKLHVASGYICQAHEGRFERDAVGNVDLALGTDFCAYSGLDGAYATITLSPLRSGYNPKTSLTPQFEEQQATGGRMIGQKTVSFGEPPLSVYTRQYETSKLENLVYTVEFTSAAVRNWVVEVTLEYADPRDTPESKDFLKKVYLQAMTQIGGK
jgi:hypothetical protein